MSRKTIARRGAGIVLAAGIAGAAFGAAPAPADAARQPVCIQAPKVTKFLSVENPFGPDHSFAKLTWSPELCPNGSGWRVFSDPVLTETGAGSVLGYGLNLEAPARSGTGVTYRGQLRACLPIGAGYARPRLHRHALQHAGQRRVQHQHRLAAPGELPLPGPAPDGPRPAGHVRLDEHADLRAGGPGAARARAAPEG